MHKRFRKCKNKTDLAGQTEKTRELKHNANMWEFKDALI